MATEQKAIDLGKLQAAHKVAQSVVKMQRTAHSKSQRELEAAQRNVDRWAMAVEESQKSLDRAKNAMLEGARTVAQG